MTLSNSLSVTCAVYKLTLYSIKSKHICRSFGSVHHCLINLLSA